MARVFTSKDRLEVRCTAADGSVVKVKIAPLNGAQKRECVSSMRVVAGRAVADLGDMVYKAVKFSLKEIHGLEDSEGKPFPLQFENGVLTDKCVDDLMNCEDLTIREGMQASCVSMVSGIPERTLVDPVTKKKVEGVVVLYPGDPEPASPN